jgi:hypothetical protein
MVKPPLEGNHRPYIKIDNQIPNGTGQVDKDDVETIDSCTSQGACAFPVFVTRYATVQILGTASDPVAGIKSFSVSVTKMPENNVLFSIHSAASLDPKGRAASEMGFVGGDGAGGMGLKIPIQFTASSFYVEVVAEATNFENNSNKLIIDYTPLDPVTASISVSPTTIDRFGQSTLKFGANNATGVSLIPNIATPSSTIFVSPPTTTTYYLTASQPFHSNTVGFPNPPPMPGQTLHPGSAHAQATLTVNQPPAPVANPATVIFYLQRQQVSPPDGGSAPIPYANTFGVLGAVGTITQLQNINAYPVYFLNAGHLSSECFVDSSATTVLNPNQSTTQAQMHDIFGSESPQFPTTILACVAAGSTPPNLVALSVTYTHQ